MRYFINFLLFLNLLLFSSCGTWHYTNYGKPFDFLKAQRITKVDNPFHLTNSTVEAVDKGFTCAVKDCNKTVYPEISVVVPNKIYSQDLISKKE